MSNNDNKSILQKELNTKQVLMVIGGLMIILGYIFLFIYPPYSQLKLSKGRLESLQSERLGLQKKIEEMPMLEEKVSNLESELEIKSKILKYNIKDGMFLIGLSKFMNELNVELIDYSVNEIKEYKNFYALPTTIQVRGDYQDIRRIINYLEQQNNMTQVLNFDIKTYEEDKKQDQNTQKPEVVPDSVVYWTESGTTYHKKDCPILDLEVKKNEEVVKSGPVDESGKTVADENCKPYSILDKNQEKVEVLKSNGMVTATFNFVSYSSQNPSLEFNNDNPSSWTPGKANPFKTTSR